MEQVADRVWRAGTRYVNWYVVDAGDDGLTVVDAGFPKYQRGLDASLAAIGKVRADVRAVILTHGHIDHIGMAATFAASGATVHLHPDDAALAAAPKTNKPERTMPYLLYPATMAFVGHALKQGAASPDPMPASEPLVDGAEVAAPGRPIVTHVPGHTAGSCILDFREHGVVFAGDLLCTINPITGQPESVQLQSRGSNGSSEEAMRSLDRLELITTRTVLPGHGNPWHDGVASAVASARRIGCR